MERKANTHGEIGRFIWGARLRMDGLQGLGGEEAVLASALNVHFACSDPKGWHFAPQQGQKRLQERQQ